MALPSFIDSIIFLRIGCHTRPFRVYYRCWVLPSHESIIHPHGEGRAASGCETGGSLDHSAPLGPEAQTLADRLAAVESTEDEEVPWKAQPPPKNTEKTREECGTVTKLSLCWRTVSVGVSGRRTSTGSGWCSGRDDREAPRSMVGTHQRLANRKDSYRKRCGSCWSSKTKHYSL